MSMTLPEDRKNDSNGINSCPARYKRVTMNRKSPKFADLGNPGWHCHLRTSFALTHKMNEVPSYGTLDLAIVDITNRDINLVFFRGRSAA